MRNTQAIILAILISAWDASLPGWADPANEATDLSSASLVRGKTLIETGFDGRD